MAAPPAEFAIIPTVTTSPVCAIQGTLYLSPKTPAKATLMGLFKRQARKT
jgi:hypothetical protein